MELIERDELRIPTVVLRVKHATDSLEKKKRRKKGAASEGRTRTTQDVVGALGGVRRHQEEYL